MGKATHHRKAQRTADTAAGIQRGTDQARAAIRQQTGDSFVNVAARLGYGGGSQQDGSTYQVDFISRNPFNLEAAYRSSWLCGMAVDVVAEDMTRAGIQFVSDEVAPEDGETMHKAFERMNIWGGMSDAIKWGRLYGGAILVLLVDGQNLSTPLNLNSIKPGQFKGVVALDRWQVNPSLSDLVTDYGPYLGMPKYYHVVPSAEALLNQKIHYTRCIRIDGIKLPFRQKLAENGWGQSILERLWDRVIAFDSTTAGAAQLVYKAHLRTVKIKGFRKIIAEGGKIYDAMIEGMKLMRTMQSNEGLTILDGEDDFEAHAYAFAGLDKLLQMFGEQLSGGMQIPLVRLFGQSPGGIGNDGESALRTYYDNVTKEQDQKIRHGLNVILELTSRSELGLPLPKGFAFEFVPLWQLTETEKALIAKTKTDAVVAAEGASLISPAAAAKELRGLSRLTGLYSHISDEDIAGMDDEPPIPEPAVDPTPKLEVVK